MSALISAAIVASIAYADHVPDRHGAQTLRASRQVDNASQSKAVAAAGEWLVLLDQEHWEESWKRAAPLFQTGIAAHRWAETVQAVRQPLGPVTSRIFQGKTEATSLPGAPDGQYEMVQFVTNFANKTGAIETVVMVHETDGWKVSGYFVR